MSDLISRQAAIDALKEHRALFCDNTPDTFSKLSYGEKGRVDEIDNAIATLVNLPSAQPEQSPDEWCTDCKEYDQTKHCCPRFNKVIKNTLKDTQSTTHKNAYWTDIQISVDGTSTCECSLCGAIVHSSFSDEINYCPNCGACMLGDVLTLDSQITEKQCYTITDVDFDNTREIIFRTKHGKEVKFVKESHWISCDERLPEKKKTTYWVCTEDGYQCMCRWTNVDHLGMQLGINWHWNMFDLPMHTKVLAWMPLPKPYNSEKAVK